MLNRKIKRIALVAHDHLKLMLVDWVKENKNRLEQYELCGTGTTGALIAKETGFNVHLYKSGPFGGDQQIGAAISEGKIDMLIFFWDPISPAAHDVDVKALIRLAVLWDIPTAYNYSTATALLESKVFENGFNSIPITLDK